MINPDIPAPLPPSIVPQRVTRLDGSTALLVTIKQACLLVGRSAGTMDRWIKDGRVVVTMTPDHQRRIFVDSLWAALPIELRR
jgi:hypothetical protein